MKGLAVLVLVDSLYASFTASGDDCKVGATGLQQAKAEDHEVSSVRTVRRQQLKYTQRQRRSRGKAGGMQATVRGEQTMA